MLMLFFGDKTPKIGTRVLWAPTQPLMSLFFPPDAFFLFHLGYLGLRISKISDEKEKKKTHTHTTPAHQ